MDAFVIFMSITIKFHPTEAQGMLRHIQIVRDLYTQGQVGVVYDTKFREIISQHSDIQWGEMLSISTPRLNDSRDIRRPNAQDNKDRYDNYIPSE